MKDLAICAVVLASAVLVGGCGRTSNTGTVVGEAHPAAGTVITNSIGMKMVLIPAGEFMMGSRGSAEELCEWFRRDPATPEIVKGVVTPDRYSREYPYHRVRITRPFFLGVCEVTQGQYERVMGGNPSHFRGDPQRPVESVSWNDALEFCRRLGELPEEKAVGAVYRLPTEAEWEYACRAGTTTRFSFGDDTKEAGDHAWWNANSGQQTHPVGQKKPNPWGLHDMHGNVNEWCADPCSGRGYEKSPVDDPIGEESGMNERVLRGGSWGSGSPAFLRCAFRTCGDPAFGLELDACGFRVARNP